MVSELDRGWHGRFLVSPRGDSLELTPPSSTWPLLTSPGHAEISYASPPVQLGDQNGSPHVSMSVASTAQAISDLRRELRIEMRAAVEESVRTMRVEARAEAELVVQEAHAEAVGAVATLRVELSTVLEAARSDALRAGHQAQAEAQERAVAAEAAAARAEAKERTAARQEVGLRTRLQHVMDDAAVAREAVRAMQEEVQGLQKSQAAAARQAATWAKESIGLRQRVARCAAAAQAAQEEAAAAKEAAAAAAAPAAEAAAELRGE